MQMHRSWVTVTYILCSIDFGYSISQNLYLTDVQLNKCNSSWGVQKRCLLIGIFDLHFMLLRLCLSYHHGQWYNVPHLKFLYIEWLSNFTHIIEEYSSNYQSNSFKYVKKVGHMIPFFYVDIWSSDLRVVPEKWVCTWTQGDKPLKTNKASTNLNPFYASPN